VAYPLNPRAGQCAVARVYQMHQPIFAVLLAHGDIAVAEVHGEVTLQGIVVEEVIFDDIALVAQRDHKLMMPVVGVVFEDVPEDGVAADFDHRFGLDGGFFRQPSAEAPRQNDDFHRVFQCNLTR
jgi:hypothetical protein